MAIGDPDLIIAVWDRRLHAGATSAGLHIAPAHLAVLTRVELNEIGAGLLRIADEDGYAQHLVGHREHRARPARALLDQDEATEICAGIDCDGDVLLAGQPADLHERAGNELGELGRRFGGAHERRPDENRIGSRQLGSCALRPRCDRALRDDRAVARCAGDELEL